jgi:protein-disulfide isomerase
MFMGAFRFATILGSIAIAALVAFGPVAARAEDKALSDKQEEAVKKIVHDYLAQHPEAIIEAIGAFREQQRVAAQDAAKKALADHREELVNDPNSQVFGNPQGDVTVVEFFDYHCPYCKAMADRLLDIVNTDGKVRLVMKELPILGPDSVFASRAAIASREQNLYPQFHIALMHLKGPLSEDAVMQTAKSVGIDIARLRKDMDDAKIESVINANVELARTLEIDGTPGWVVGDHATSGAMSAESFKQLIDTARKAKS